MSSRPDMRCLWHPHRQASTVPCPAVAHRTRSGRQPRAQLSRAVLSAPNEDGGMSDGNGWPTEAEYSWAEADAFCITFVEAAATVAVLERMVGGCSTGIVSIAEARKWAWAQAAPDYGSVIQGGSVGGWAVTVEGNGYTATLPEVVRRISKGSRAIVVFRNIHGLSLRRRGGRDSFIRSPPLRRPDSLGRPPSPRGVRAGLRQPSDGLGLRMCRTPHRLPFHRRPAGRPRRLGRRWASPLARPIRRTLLATGQDQHRAPGLLGRSPSANHPEPPVLR
jgi:hypothetical protein